MSILIRLSVAATMAFLVGSVVGIEVGGQARASFDAVSANRIVASTSPGAGSRKNLATRSITGLENVATVDRGMTLSMFPAANTTGPMAGNVRLLVRTSRAIASTSLMAMN